MPRQHIMVNGVVSSNHRRESPTTDESSYDSENFNKIENWRDKVETMTTRSRLCERSRIYDHLKTKSVLDRAIESLVSHTEPLYRPEGRGRRGCFGEYFRITNTRPTTSTLRKNTATSAGETNLIGESGVRYPFISPSPSKTTVTTIKEFIYNDASFPRPAYVDDLREDRANAPASAFESKRASKILKREISDIVDRRKAFVDKKKSSSGRNNPRGFTNLPSSDEYVFAAGNGEITTTGSQPQQSKKRSGGVDRKQRKKEVPSLSKILSLEGENTRAVSTDKDQESESQPRSPTKVTFSDLPDMNTETNNNEPMKSRSKPSIDWSKVNAATGDVNPKTSEQRLLKTFAQLYTDVAVDEMEDVGQNLDREVMAYKTSGHATLGIIEEPELPEHLRKK